MLRPLSKRSGVLHQSGQCFLHFLLTRVALRYPLLVFFWTVLGYETPYFPPELAGRDSEIPTSLSARAYFRAVGLAFAEYAAPVSSISISIHM